MQLDPIKHTSQAPGPWRLKPKYEEPLSNFAFNFNLRRYTEAIEESVTDSFRNVYKLVKTFSGASGGPELAAPLAVANATKEKLESFKVGRCRLTLSNPC